MKATPSLEGENKDKNMANWKIIGCPIHKLDFKEICLRCQEEINEEMAEHISHNRITTTEVESMSFGEKRKYILKEFIFGIDDLNSI